MHWKLGQDFIDLCRKKNKNLEGKEIIKIKNIYNKEFYEDQALQSYNSAKIVINIINELFPNIDSVLDIGCGIGTWLKAWKEIKPDIKYKGMDANEIPEELLYIERENIKIVDLENINDEKEDKKYSIIESLEVGEHLSESVAKNYVNFMCSHSDLILFSAAIPKQGGCNHINEQYLEYWNQLFKQEGFECFDIIREQIWNTSEICWWYRQNTVIYAKDEMITYLKNHGFNSTNYLNTYYHPNFVDAYIK